MVDLEPLVGQYDPGMIFVGPLLSHSKNSRFHYFYIAGNGTKVYETINLGFVDVESNARTQRADLVVKLESRFTEVLTFCQSPRDGAGGPCALAKCGDSQVSGIR